MFTLEQLEFLGVYVGAAIPPEFIENQRRAEKYKKQAAEIAARSDELRQRRDGEKLEGLLNRAKASAEAKDFALALDWLDQVETGLAAPDVQPPLTELPDVQPPPPLNKLPVEIVDEKAEALPPRLNKLPVEIVDEKADVLPPPVNKLPVEIVGEAAEELPPPPLQPVPDAQPVVAAVPVAPSAADEKTLKKLVAEAAKLHETARRQFWLVRDLQGRFADQQDARDAAKSANDADAAKVAMAKALGEAANAISAQTSAVKGLDDLKKKLAALTVADGADAADLRKQLQDAVAEVDQRLNKTTAVEQQCVALHGKMKTALDTGGKFMVGKDGIAAYDTNALEIPGVLSELLDRISATQKQFNAASARVAEMTAQIQNIWPVVTAGKPLSGDAAKQLGAMDQEMPEFPKNFGRWNAPIIRDWREVTGNITRLKVGAQPEIKKLKTRGEKAYDEYSLAFGTADETYKNLAQLYQQVKKFGEPTPATPKLIKESMAELLSAVESLATKAGDPIDRLDTYKESLAAKRKEVAALKPNRPGDLDAIVTDVNQELEKAKASAHALERSSLELEFMNKLLKNKLSKVKPEKAQVARFEKLSEALDKKLTPASKEYAKVEAGFVALQELLQKKVAEAKAAAPAPDSARLAAGIKSLPKLPGKETLFPPNGVAGWKKDAAKGGDKAIAKLFADVLKTWEEAEKKTTEANLDKLEKSAAACTAALESIADKDKDDTDRLRSDKCRQALGLVRKMRLKTDLESLPPPPWNEKQAAQARQVEARALLENGTPAKPPGEKGESDSFFLKNAEGKPAFIFKPKQGENVKEGGKQGEGVVREVLSSKFNDQIKQMTGLDFGICPTSLTRLESDSFAAGEKSKEKSRIGALQQAAPNEGSLLKRMSEDPQLVKSIKTEDVQRVALLDFMTLQGDRNPSNLLLQDVDGEKRLVPIDGGFAFPTTDLFKNYAGGMASDLKFDPDRPPPADENERRMIESDTMGQNAIMQLPQSAEKFTPDMLKHVDSLDPDAVVKGMKAANKELEDAAPDLKGMVGDENLENVRRSLLFLKQAAREFTVAELGEIYALDFKRILAAPPKQMQKEIEAVIAQGRARREFNKKKNADQAEFEKLGGDVELKKLGWKPEQDRLLRANWKRKVEILKKREAPPAAKPDAAQPEAEKPSADAAALDGQFKKLGGEKEFQKVFARPDFSPKINGTIATKTKVARLLDWKDYNSFGGDKAYAKLVDFYFANQYTPFDELPKDGQAAVAVFSTSRGDPVTFGLGSKLKAFQDYTAFKK